jgi:lysophospholipase L1-like esterase
MRRLVFVFIVLLAFACNGGGQKLPTPTPEPSASATPGATATPLPALTLAPTTAPSPTPALTPTTTPQATPTPSPTPTAAATPTPTSAPQASTAAYLSLGDSIQYGCCGDPMRSSGELFRQYLSERLNRPVEWLSLADAGTAQSFIHGYYELEPQPPPQPEPQLDRAVALLDDLRSQGEPVAAITMCIGGNDFLFLEDPEDGHPCHAEGSPGCLQVFLEMLERYKGQLDLILTTLDETKDPHTPLLLLNYYDAWDYGEFTPEYMATEPGLFLINQTIAEAADKYEGVFLVDIYPLFKGKAREYIAGVDPTYEGHAVIAEAYREVYESLPPEFVQPFEGGAPSEAP